MPRIYKPPRGKRKRSKKGTSNPPEPTKKELLEKAINTAPVSGLRYALQNLCDKVPGAASYAEIYMLVREKEVTKGKNQVSIAESEDEDDSTAEEEESSEDESDEEVNQRSRANKSDIGVGKMRLRLRWATCARCNEEFDVALNNRGDCVWHDGEKEIDSDADTWNDWDERCHGNKHDQEEAYPAGFIYTCCDGDGDSEGCKSGRHKEKIDTHKGTRY